MVEAGGGCVVPEVRERLRLVWVGVDSGGLGGGGVVGEGYVRYDGAALEVGFVALLFFDVIPYAMDALC